MTTKQSRQPEEYSGGEEYSDDEEWLRAGGEESEDDSYDSELDYDDSTRGAIRGRQQKQQSFQGRPTTYHPDGSKSLPLAKRGPPVIGYSDLVAMAMATLRTEGLRDANLTQVYDYLMSLTSEVADTLRVAETQSKTVWTDMQLNKAFLTELLKQGRLSLDSDLSGMLGERLMSEETTESYRIGSAGPATGAPAAQVSGGGAGRSTAAVVYGEPTFTRLDLLSSNRDNAESGLPNVMRFGVVAESGLALKEVLQRIRSVQLVSVAVNTAIQFTERPEGAPFWVTVDEISDDNNRQSDGHAQGALWQCFSKPSDRRSTVRVDILSDRVHFPVIKSSLSTLTLRFLDEDKNPLAVEQDYYPILTTAWNDAALRLTITLNPHTIRTGDLVLMKGLSIVEAPGVFDKSNRFKAIVINLTTIEITAYRSPATPRTIITNGAAVICNPNIIRVSLDFKHQV